MALANYVPFFQNRLTNLNAVIYANYNNLAITIDHVQIDNFVITNQNHSNMIIFDDFHNDQQSVIDYIDEYFLIATDFIQNQNITLNFINRFYLLTNNLLDHNLINYTTEALIRVTRFLQRVIDNYNPNILNIVINNNNIINNMINNNNINNINIINNNYINNNNMIN
jgi:hypothetical protein